MYQRVTLLCKYAVVHVSVSCIVVFVRGCPCIGVLFHCLCMWLSVYHCCLCIDVLYHCLSTRLSVYQQVTLLCKYAVVSVSASYE